MNTDKNDRSALELPEHLREIPTGYSLLYDSSKGYTGTLAQQLLSDDRIQDLFPRTHRGKFRTNLKQFLYNLLQQRQQQRLIDERIEERKVVKVAIPLSAMFREKSRYKRQHMSYRQVRRIIDAFEDMGFIAVNEGKPRWSSLHTGRGNVTLVMPTDEFGQMLDEYLGDMPGNVDFIMSEEGIEAKADGAMWEYEDTPKTRAMRNALKACNERISALNWTLELPMDVLGLNGEMCLSAYNTTNIQPTSEYCCIKRNSSTGTLSEFEWSDVSTTNYHQPTTAALSVTLQDTIAERARSLTDLKPHIRGGRLVYELEDYHIQAIRKFCRGDFQHGGRFYASYQNLPSEWRQHLRADGEPTVELDYDGLHAHMLYHTEGLEMPYDDPYSISGLGIDRGTLKRLWFVLINAKNHQSMYAYVKNNLDLSGHRATEVVQAMRDKHSAIADYFHSDYGVKLQYMDSKIASRVMKRVPALCVHDSFVCKQSDEGDLKQAMEEEYEKEMGYSCAVHSC